MGQPNYNFPKIRFCRNGHAIIGDNALMYKKDRVRREIRCKICDRERERRKMHRADLPEHTVREFARRVFDERATLHELGGKSGTKWIGNRVANPTRLMSWCKAHPKLGNRIMAQVRENGKARRLEIIASRRLHVAPKALSRNMGVFEVIEAALPRWLESDDRRDLVTDMWMAVGEGLLLPADIPRRAREFVSTHRKKYTNTGRYAFNSLDAPTSDDNPTSRIERLTDADRLWWSEA
jgi:hypothetical protein